jgi:hypothetical protein
MPHSLCKHLKAGGEFMHHTYYLQERGLMKWDDTHKKGFSFAGLMTMQGLIDKEESHF